MNTRIDFPALAAAALNGAESLLAGWLPDGHREGHEWRVRNPTRADHAIGSFSINLDTGAWADFATDDKGGDLISLCAYLYHGGDQSAAARDLAARIGFSAGQSPRPPLQKLPKKKRSPWTPILTIPDDP